MRAEVGKIKENIEIITNSARHGLVSQKKKYRKKKRQVAGGLRARRRKTDEGHKKMRAESV